MKKLSLFGLLGLLAFVTMPIYAQDVYFDENYIIVPEDVSVENLDEEDVIVEGEINNEVEEDEVVLAVEEEPTIEGDTNIIDENGDYEPTRTISLNDDVIPLEALEDSKLNGRLYTLLGLFSAAGIVLFYLFFVWLGLLPISIYEIYKKAGKKGWAFFVPFWGSMVYSEIAGMNKWLGLLPWLVTIRGFFQGLVGSGTYGIVLNVLSIISLLWIIIANYRVARRYGRNIFASILHAVIIFCPITILILGLGNYKYQGKSETVVEA